MHTDIEPSYQIYMSTNPFEDIINIKIGPRGDHKTLSLKFTNNENIGIRPQLQECTKSTPAPRIPK